MAAINSTGSRNKLLMLHSSNEKDVIASYKLKKEINRHYRQFCFTLESYASQSYPQSMDHAISTAQFYLLFLTKALLKYDDHILVSGIDTILERIQDESHKLIIVLFELPMSSVKGKRSLNLLQYQLENAIDTSQPDFKKGNNSKEYEWEKIADQVYEKLNIDSATTISLSPSPGK